MKRLFFLVLVALAAWIGWKKWPQFMERRPSHEVVLVNQTGQTLEHIRVMVDGQTLVREHLAEGESATLPFRVQRDASFELEAQWGQREGLIRWRGGQVPAGPMVQRHILTIDPDGQILYQPQNK